MFQPVAIFVVDDDSECELTEVLALHAQRRERIAELRNGGCFGVIDEVVLVAFVIPVLKVGDKAGLRVVVMSAARGDLFAGLLVGDGMPFGDDMKVGRDVE